LACLNAAAIFCAAKVLVGLDVKSTDVLKIADAFERWAGGEEIPLMTRCGNDGRLPTLLPWPARLPDRFTEALGMSAPSRVSRAQGCDRNCSRSSASRD
jgi:hypothetical protein